MHLFGERNMFGDAKLRALDSIYRTLFIIKFNIRESERECRQNLGIRSWIIIEHYSMQVQCGQKMNHN